jgi:hypothetical protein
MKIRPDVFLQAGHDLDHYTYCCFAICEAPDDYTAAELGFFREIFGLGVPGRGRYSFEAKMQDIGCRIPSLDDMRALRLMSLALAHTLAIEHNNGEFSLNNT